MTWRSILEVVALLAIVWGALTIVSVAVGIAGERRRERERRAMLERLMREDPWNSQ